MIWIRQTIFTDQLFFMQPRGIHTPRNKLLSFCMLSYFLHHYLYHYHKDGSGVKGTIGPGPRAACPTLEKKEDRGISSTLGFQNTCRAFFSTPQKRPVRMAKVCIVAFCRGSGRADVPLPLPQTRWSYDSRQLAVAGRSLDIVEPNPIHGRLLVLV